MKLLKRLALTFFSITFSLVLLKAGIDAAKPDLPVKISGDYPIVDDQEIGFIAATNASALREHDIGLRYHIFTDGRGARANKATKKAPTHADIITVGCSYTWGHGVENEQTYSSIIERKTGLSVSNLALSSYGTVQSVLRLKRNTDLKPKYVIYGWINSHIQRNLSPCAPSYLPICSATAYVDFAPDPYIHKPIFSDSVSKSRAYYYGSGFFGVFNTTAIAAEYRPRESRYLESADKRMDSSRFILSQLDEVVSAAGAQLIILDLTNASGAKKPRAQELYSNIPAGAIFLDMGASIGSLDHRALGLPRDGHPNARAHNIIAGKVIEVLR